MIYTVALIGHLLGACIWVGGHLYLSFCLLPNILRTQDVAGLLSFECSFERLGMSALALQVVTGLVMVKLMLPNVSLWLSGAGFLSHIVTAKFALLALTIITALHARFRVISRLSVENLHIMAWHIVAITVLSVGFLLVGVGLRLG